jgi:hypothetical protein
MKSQLVTSYRFKISRMLTKHFRSELFDDSEHYLQIKQRSQLRITY